MRLTGSVRPFAARAGRNVLADVASEIPADASQAAQLVGAAEVLVGVDGARPSGLAAGPVVPGAGRVRLAMAAAAGLAFPGASAADLIEAVRPVAPLGARQDLGSGRGRRAPRVAGSPVVPKAGTTGRAGPSPRVGEARPIRQVRQKRRP